MKPFLPSSPSIPHLTAASASLEPTLLPVQILEQLKAEMGTGCSAAEPNWLQHVCKRLPQLDYITVVSALAQAPYTALAPAQVLDWLEQVPCAAMWPGQPLHEA